MLYYVFNVMSINVKTKCYDSTDVYFPFDIHVRHDIMQAFPFLWRPTTSDALSPTMSGLGVPIRTRLVGSSART